MVARPTVKVGDRDFQALLGALPKDFDVLFYGGIAEAAYVLKQMREMGLDQLFACGDGCWSVKGFIQPAGGAATKGEGVLVLSAAPAVGRVPGSQAFAERYAKRFGPIANYAANSYDAARVLLLPCWRRWRPSCGFGLRARRSPFWTTPPGRARR